ncbi:hypothetical protein PTKIN_Ptkin01aG0091700 [Pterospermum kingtungense]
MAEVQLEVEITEQEANKETNSTEQITNITDRRRGSGSNKNYKWWLRIFVYTIFVLCGQSIATILGRLYFEKGGNNKWVATLAQIGGFPVILPFYTIFLCKNPNANSGSTIDTNPYLPVSTVTIIIASQLAFNAFFSYFMNSQKFTPYIINSLVLLTVSSVLLVANNHSEKPDGVSKSEYAAGFICTICGAEVYGFLLSSQQLAFRKVLKRSTLKVVLDVIFYQSMVASSTIIVGLFASGDWKGLKKEMEEYALGKTSYVMTLLWTAITWQVFTMGTVGLTFEVSSLYSNAIGTVGLPIVPVVAVFVFHDKMDGIKGISMALAIWGFISYAYQNYLEHKKSKIENRIATVISPDSSPANQVNRADIYP